MNMATAGRRRRYLVNKLKRLRNNFIYKHAHPNEESSKSPPLKIIKESMSRLRVKYLNRVNRSAAAVAAAVDIIEEELSFIGLAYWDSFQQALKLMTQSMKEKSNLYFAMHLL